MASNEDWEDVPIDDWEDVSIGQKLDKNAGDAARFLKEKVGPAIGSTIGKASEMVGRYTTAPIKAGIGAAVEGRNPFTAAAEQFGEPTSKAPELSEIARQAGIPVDASIPLPLQKNLQGDKYRASVGDAIDVVGGAAIDPLTYVGGGVAKQGAKIAGEQLASSLSPKVASYLGKKAEERAVKAATGQNVRALRDVAGISAKSAGDVGKAEANLQRAGRDILNSGQLGWTDKVESLAPKLNAEKRSYGEQIGKIGEAIDQAKPQAVSSENIAKELTAYADSLPNTPAGVKIKERLYDKAAEYEKSSGMSFADAQFEKNQYKFKPGEADALVSNQDVSNKIQKIISDEMEGTADNLAKESPELAGLLGDYKNAKQKYRSFKLTGDAATDRSVKNLSNRFVSPSDYGMGGAGAVLGGIATGGAGLPAMAAGAGAAAANKLLRERGSAFAARALDAVSKGITAGGQTLGKYQPILERAAQEGGRSLAVTHHLLLKNDPEYIKTMDGIIND